VVLIGWVVAVVVVAVMVAVVLLRRRSYDDVHSVEHYHRQLHTLEEMRGQPETAPEAKEAGSVAEVSQTGAFTAPAPGSSTVRLTDLDKPVIPPPPPPSVPESAARVRFDDTAPAESDADGPRTAFPHPDDKAMHSIDHAPRRLGGPLAAIGVAVVLVVVLIVTGLHGTTPTHHGGSSTATTTAHTPTTVAGHSGTKVASHGGGHHGRGTATTTTTTTTAAPVVSAPSAVTSGGATYQVTAATYSLSLAASSGECWVEATNPSTNAILFSGTLLAGQSHIVAATGPVTVIAGAPGVFVATVNGVAVTMPTGAQAPFTLTFLTPQTTAGTTTTLAPATT
jgi:hypothetical protein